MLESTSPSSYPSKGIVHFFEFGRDGKRNSDHLQIGEFRGQDFELVAD